MNRKEKKSKKNVSALSGSVELDLIEVTHFTKDLEGKLKTYVDATYTDKEQRDAHKSIIGGILWNCAESIVSMRTYRGYVDYDGWNYTYHPADSEDILPVPMGK